ncbi:hypothetical protein GI582_23845 [Sulfitobacter sp. BDSS02]|nr:hypothetical protein [Sulfitobacter sp. BDSS02]MBR9852127.1 hypothetical protein [Paracoccaceae bacterium]
MATMALMLEVGAVMYVMNARAAKERAEANDLALVMSHVKRDLLQARRTEKDFLLRSEARYVEQHAEIMARIGTEIQAAAAAAADLGVDQADARFAEMMRGIAEYETTFDRLQAAMTTLGLDPKSGLQGELRAAVHDVEESLKTVDSAPLQVKMLMMRRHASLSKTWRSAALRAAAPASRNCNPLSRKAAATLACPHRVVRFDC